MSVTEQPVEPMPEAFSTDLPALDAQAALELAHELVLVTRATFAQLLSETAARAVSGVPGIAGATVVTASPSPAPASTQVAPMPAISVAAAPAPVPASPITATAATVPVSASAIAVPVVAASGDPSPGLDDSAAVSEQQSQGIEVDSIPTISLSIPSATMAIEEPTGYVPVPGVETPAAVPVTPLVQAAPIPAPISLSVAGPVAETAPEPEATEPEFSEPVEPVAPLRPFHPNLAMLEEIGFLDE